MSASAPCGRGVIGRYDLRVISAIAIEFERLLSSYVTRADVANKAPYPLVALLPYLVLGAILLVEFVANLFALCHGGGIHAYLHGAVSTSSFTIGRILRANFP